MDFAGKLEVNCCIFYLYNKTNWQEQAFFEFVYYSEVSGNNLNIVKNESKESFNSRHKTQYYNKNSE